MSAFRNRTIRGVPRLVRARQDWVAGVGFGYPYCCVAHYCWDVFVGRAPGIARSEQVGFREASWVPCGFWHAPGTPYGVFRRVGRIVVSEFSRHHTKLNLSPRCAPSYAEVRWWRELALSNEFSYGDARGPLCPGAGLDPDLDWI